MNRKPQCVIVTGRPGAGKSTLAKKLGEHLRMPVVCRDEIKEGYVNTYGIPHDELPSDVNALVSNAFFDIVSHYLACDISVIIEAAFQQGVWTTRLPQIQEVASLVIVLCSVEEEVAAMRHLQRGLQNPSREFYHGDKRVTHYKQTGEILPPDSYAEPRFNVPTIRVSTQSDYTPTLQEIATQIRSLNAPNTM